jgi:hypothetical protein
MFKPLLTDRIQSEILSHIRQCGGSFAGWYCGIAADPRDCLFNRHGVDAQNGAWIYRDCGSELAARQVESYFHSLGCQGAGGGGSVLTRFVYAYVITPKTRE